MKKYISMAVISLLLFSCGGSDSEPENTAPTVPVLTAPANNTLCISNVVNFQWNPSTDSNNDPITYILQVAKDQQFMQIAANYEGAANSSSITLEKGKAYYWRVQARDDKNLYSWFSATYSFYTSGDAVVNYLPFAPEPIRPAFNSVLSAATATLEWKATDIDTGDKLVYDVYFGTDSTPTVKVAENIGTTTIDVSLQSAKEYFWKVVVRDNKGGETIGQVWKFKTN